MLFRSKLPSSSPGFVPCPLYVSILYILQSHSPCNKSELFNHDRMFTRDIYCCLRKSIMAQSQRPQIKKQPNKKQAPNPQRVTLQLSLFSQGLRKDCQNWPHRNQFLHQPPFTKSFKWRFVGLTGIAGAFLWYGKRKEYIPASQRHVDWYPTQDAFPAQGALGKTNEFGSLRSGMKDSSRKWVLHMSGHWSERALQSLCGIYTSEKNQHLLWRRKQAELDSIWGQAANSWLHACHPPSGLWAWRPVSIERAYQWETRPPDKGASALIFGLPVA